MSRITVKVSDLTGKQIQNEQSGARLIIEHPDYPEPVGLDVLPDEILPHLNEENSRFVVVYLEDQDNPNPKRYVLSVDDFERLFQTGDSTSTLQSVYETQRQEHEVDTGQLGRGTQDVPSGSIGPTRERIDYASPEHAGEPHRGMISEAEQLYVRENLAEVNQRLRQKGMREIDLNDPRMASRYGFPLPDDDGAITDDGIEGI